MPTPSGKETTRERETRQRAEDFAAIRAAITEPIRDKARADARAVAAGQDPPQYPAGELVKVREGRRPYTVDEGEISRLALVDALEEIGLRVIAHTVKFGLYAGRSSVFYSVSLGR